MQQQAATNDGKRQPQVDLKSFKLKVPKNREEEKILKEGYEEDDNEDIAYLNFPLIWPIGLTSAASLTLVVLGCVSTTFTNHLHYERFALNQLLFSYGNTFGFCNNTYPMENGMWPSFLRQLEMKVMANVSFRIAVCVPIAVRIFVALVIRNSYRDFSAIRSNVLLNAFNEFTVIFVIIEVLNLALFSIVTIRFDFPKLYDMALGLFVFAACIHMFLRTVLSFTADFSEPIQQFATIVRLTCSVLFTWTSSQVFQTHQAFIKDPSCHGFVPPRDALSEYAAVVSYIAFALTLLIDIRDIRFICYPRTCSGECEPLRPENFAKGGRYEHCRPYEYQQRWVNGVDDRDEPDDDLKY